jgi:hypothetical protein
LPTLSACSPYPRPATIRVPFVQHGELSAAIELRRLFPGITDNVQARECARTIAGWKPLPVMKLRRGKRPGRTDAAVRSAVRIPVPAFRAG